MEALVSTISFLLLIGLISVPILLFLVIKKSHRLKFHFVTYLISAVILTAVIMWIFAWWSDYSNQLLLSHYGYDFNAINETERFQNIAEENFERVKEFEIGYFGIGWTSKAIISFAFYFPYLLTIYPIGQYLMKLKFSKGNK